VNALWHVFKFELIRVGRRRAYLFTTVAIPILAIVAMFGYQAYRNWQDTRNVDKPAAEENADVGKIGYVDHSGLFPDPGLFGTALIRYPDDQAALDAMKAGEVDSVFVIAVDYLETGDVTQYIDTFSIGTMEVEGFVRSCLVNTLLQGVDRELVQRLQSDLHVVEHLVTQTGEATVAKSEGSSFLLVYVFALLLAFATFFSGGYLLQGVVEEKETRMVEVLLSTLQPRFLLAGKVLASGLLGLIQILIWSVTAIFIMDRLSGLISSLNDLSVPPDLLLWSVLYFIVGFLFFAGGYAAIGAVSSSQREGPQLAVFITLPAMLPFYFLTVIIDSPNGTLAMVMSLFPLTAPIGMIQRLAVTDVPLVQILLSLGLLGLATVGMIGLAGRLFRMNTLLAGQAPKWRDLVRLARGG
jgi:ABC-2 type transport system permease protein